MFFAYELLDKTIADSPSQRFVDGSTLLIAVREAIRLIECEANYIDRNAPQRCIYCRRGYYKVQVEYTRTEERIPGTTSTTAKKIGDDALVRDFGFEPKGSYWLIAVCNRCGNVQMFRPDLTGVEAVWQEKKEGR
jgi:hypothetical protein